MYSIFKWILYFACKLKHYPKSEHFKFSNMLKLPFINFIWLSQVCSNLHFLLLGGRYSSSVKAIVYAELYYLGLNVVSMMLKMQHLIQQRWQQVGISKIHKKPRLFSLTHLFFRNIKYCIHFNLIREATSKHDIIS